VIAGPALEIDSAPATEGGIAVINLHSARRRSWARFWQDPHRPAIAEYLVEQEQVAAQFLGDMGAFERIAKIVDHLERVDADSARTTLMQAQFASMTHRFEDARNYVASAARRGAPPAATGRLSLSINQACGRQIDTVLAVRRAKAAADPRLEDLVPLGALLADLGDFAEAERIYIRALREYDDVSPFALAWVCFQLGALWGELVTEPETARAAQWYERALDYLPLYVKARVHLAEVYSECGRTEDAEGLLRPVLASGDPEVYWRLADLLAATGKIPEAEGYLQTARAGFEQILQKYLLAFADHGAEFYAGSGGDPRRAFELASINLANRSTPRAFELAHATALGAGETRCSSAACDTRCNTGADLC
jgi:tetratricopeptide (TPR) repeat protein